MLADPLGDQKRLRVPWWVWVIAFLVGSWGCTPKYEFPRSTVHVIQVGEGNGSGVMIEQFLMLTAAHVVGNGKDVTVGPRKLPAKLLYIDRANDIALLHVAIACPCAPIATPPAVDDPVVIIGFPINQHVHVQMATEGLIQGRWDNRLTMSANAAGGNSGGGVFVYQEGQWKLAGILVEVAGWCMGGMMCFPVTHISRAVATETMTQFLRGAL